MTVCGIEIPWESRTLEVLGDTSQRKDLVEHLDDYAAARVREYWIVDARGADLVFRVLVLGRDGRYRDSTPQAEDWRRSSVSQRHFRIRRLPDRAGLREYTLDIRATEWTGAGS